MIDAVKISNGLVGLIGFKQPFNPDYAIVDTDNQASASGYYVTDNSYAKIEYIKDAQDYKGISNTNFNTLLVNLKKSAITDVCNQVFNDFDFIDRSLFYKYASNKVDSETLPIGFVGYRIKTSSDKNLAFKINRVLLDFNGTGDIKLLLWNTAKKTVIQSKTITISSDHQETVLDWVCDNSSNTYKGDYYIGYINNNLTVSPYKREWGNSSILTIPSELCVEKVSYPNHLTETLFDISQTDGLSEDTGLNFDITVYDDYTDFVLNNKMLFARAVYLSAVIKCMQIYVSSLRSNGNELKTAELYQKVMIEINGASELGSNGLVGDLIGEISQIKQEIGKMRKGFTKQNQIMVSTLE